MSKIQIQKVKDDTVFVEGSFRKLLKILQALRLESKSIVLK